MRITFDAKPVGGLRVIGEIPDHPLVHLEGRNGIGKTVAVRLLELSTGGQPYMSQVPAWRSLKQHLGEAQITIEGVRGGSTLKITLKPELWPDKPTIGATLGAATLDGSAIDFADVRQFLSVVRIGGDETITMQIRTRLAEDIALLDQKNDLLNQNIARLERLLDRVSSDLEGLSPEHLALVEEQERAASLLRERTGAEYRQAAELLGKHEELGRLISLLEALKEQAPSIDMAIAGTDSRIRDVAAK